jgi:hypothetical protein
MESGSLSIGMDGCLLSARSLTVTFTTNCQLVILDAAPVARCTGRCRSTRHRRSDIEVHYSIYRAQLYKENKSNRAF